MPYRHCQRFCNQQPIFQGNLLVPADFDQRLLLVT